MALFVGNEQLLACTAGQVKGGIGSLGVSYEDIAEFKNHLSSLLPQEVLIYFDGLNGEQTYYNDRWRFDYGYFQERFRFKEQEQQARSVEIQLMILNGKLEEELSKIGKRLSSKQNPIDMATENFRDYYGERYGNEFLTSNVEEEKDSVLQRRLSI